MLNEQDSQQTRTAASFLGSKNLVFEDQTQKNQVSLKDEEVKRMRQAKVNNNRIFKRFRFKHSGSKGQNEARSDSDAYYVPTSKSNKDELENFISEHPSQRSNNVCIKLTIAKSNKKAESFMNEFDANLKPNFQLPMVKFDSEGDFSKEPTEGKLFFPNLPLNQ